MKKFGLLLAGGISAIVLLANLGPMFGLMITLGISYYAVKGFLKTESTMKKIMWAVLGIIMLTATISQVPALIGLVAAYVLYVVYKKWSKPSVKESHDPFTNFENEWASLK